MPSSILYVATEAALRARLQQDIVALVDTREAEPKKRGPYKPRQPRLVISN